MINTHPSPVQRRLTRRTVLRGLRAAVDAGPAAAVGGSPRARMAHAATGLPLTVVNEGGTHAPQAITLTLTPF